MKQSSMDNNMKCNLCVFSLNVNGLGDPTKRTALLSHLKTKHKGVFLLQETHSIPQTELAWRNTWGNNNVFFSHGTSNSKGAVILISDGIEFKITKEIKDDNGRYLILEINIDNSLFTIGNIYAPTKNYEKDQIQVLHDFHRDLLQCSLEHTIIGGDYNLCLDITLDKFSNMASGSDNSNFRKEVISFLESLELVDIWRVMNPNQKIFTWHRNKQRSRLDYLFTSEHLLNSVSNVEILPGLLSDHSLLKVQLNSIDKHSTGKGFWKFNASLLHDNLFVKKVKDLIKSCGEKHAHLEDKRLVWEFIKFSIRNYTISYSSYKKKQQSSLTKNLEIRFNQLHNLILSEKATELEIEEFNCTKHELEQIERHKARGIMLRSRCQWVEEGEKNTSYFLRLEKHNYCNKHITQLQVEDSIVMDPKDILKYEKEFYEKLYSENINSNSESVKRATDLFTKSNNISKLTENEKSKCDMELSEAEILKAVKQLKNGKSPGTDGSVADFYKFFWVDIKIFVLASLQYSLKMGELSVEQKRGIITLIPKKDKNRLFLKNWRPITLLNVDYKILTKVLGNRLLEVLPHLIHDDQTGYIKGRFIGCNIRLIEDVMFYTEKNDIPGIILNVDFEKAFDSLNWNFIIKSLEAFNFGEKFISYIKTLYNDISSTIINNGTTSEWFSPKRGVRQGCPISAYLFIIAVELLAINIRENKNIRGITIDGTEIKISQLADDTNCFVKDTDSVLAILNTFGNFKICAGLAVNIDKTKGNFIGALKHETTNPFGLDWSGKYVSSLGICISGDESDLYELNYKSRILNMKNLLNSWKGRKLSLKGKVTVINTLAITPLLYVASVIHTPEKVFKEVKDLIVEFMWNGKGKKIAYDVLIQTVEEGGLKLVDFESKVKTLKISWIKRMVTDNMQNWKAAPSSFLNTTNFGLYFMCNQGKKEITPKFYQDIHNYWSELQNIEKIDPYLIINQVIWNNRYLTINKKPFLWTEWRTSGIVYIHDILNNEGQFLSQNEINELYEINCNFLNALQIRQCIPLNWRVAIQNSNIDRIKKEERNLPALIINGKRYILQKVKTNILYWAYVKKKARRPSCIQRWYENYPNLQSLESNIWETIFSFSFNITRETTLQSFQYRLIHRIIPCNNKLYEWRLTTDTKCTYCNHNDDDIVHFILYCPKTRAFWLYFFKWWNRLSDVQIPLDYEAIEESILFGFQVDEDVFKVFNYCVLVAKYYVYKQKLFNDNKIDNYEYLCELKYKLQVEENVCKKNGTTDTFQKFYFIYEEL